MKLPRALSQLDLFDCGLFLYFVTLHADILSFELAGYTIRINNLIAVVLFALLITRFRLPVWSFNRKLILGLLSLCAVVVISLVFSPYKARCFVYFGWFLFTLLFYVLLPYSAIRLLGWNKVFALYFASFLCVGSYALCQLGLSFFGIHDPFNECQLIVGTIVRPQAFAREPCYYVTYMTPIVFLYNFYFLSGTKEPLCFFEKPRIRHLIFINLLYLISTSGAVIFAYFAFFGILVVGSGIRLKKIAAAGVQFCVVGLGLGILFPNLVKNYFLRFFYHGFMSHHSIYERWWGITDSWKVFTLHPFAGVGLGGLPKYLEAAFLKGDTRFDFLYCYLPKNSELFSKDPLGLFDSTNIITELLASLGILGLLAFLIFGVILFLQYKSARVHNREFAFSSLGSLVMLCVVLCFYSGLMRTYVWVHMALVFAQLEYFSCSIPILARISHQHSSRFGQTVFPDVEEPSEGRVKLTLPRMDLKADGNTVCPNRPNGW